MKPRRFNVDGASWVAVDAHYLIRETEAPLREEPTANGLDRVEDERAVQVIREALGAKPVTGVRRRVGARFAPLLARANAIDLVRLDDYDPDYSRGELIRLWVQGRVVAMVAPMGHAPRAAPSHGVSIPVRL